MEMFGGLEEYKVFREQRVEKHHWGWERSVGRKGEEGRLVLSRQDFEFCVFNENFKAELSFP